MPSSDEDTVDSLLASLAKENVGASPQEKTTFYIFSILTASIPVYLFITIFDLDVWTFLPLFLIVTIGAAFMLSYTYQNMAVSMKKRLISQREPYLTLRSVQQESVSKGERPHALVKRKKEELAKLSSSESVGYAIFYNNVSFLLAIIVFSTFLFKSFPVPINYALSTALSVGLLTLNSGQS